VIKLTDILNEILSEKKKKRDRCLRIADRKYDKPSAYKSAAAERCRQGDIWKDIKEGKYDDQGEGGLYTLVKNSPFDIKKLVDKKIIFVTKPGDGKGGVEEPNREGDASILTLWNMSKAEPWMKVAIQSPMPEAIPHIQKRQDKLIYNGKYNQILWGIEKKGLNPEDFYTNIKEADDPQAGKAAPYGSGYAKVKQAIQELLKEDESLDKWFKRQGAPGKEGGWVDCNTCRNGKCKSCGRKKGEKRAKYPSCRPTPSQCKQPGKGKKWGKTK
jgi:hypothetical protein